ncbi:Deoxyribonuclease gamma [Bagarius yarrelli]|uniref:Deoxyribonuclease gamma n=1 Tax=Bagarius yarrelli TaxID=175774 RepID=A0A556U400_BAGYA|nr:Deoxyribonuclease gamma [Bagarius yarrelli]
MKPAVFFLLSLGGALSLKICSFNIRSFGERKILKQDVLNVILESIMRCDIMLIMEIKDVKGQAFPQLINHLNRKFHGQKHEYGYAISQRLGRKSYKEQYGFIYRRKLVSVKSVYQYPDTQPEDIDAFAREPFVVWFSSPTTGKKKQPDFLFCLCDNNINIINTIVMGVFPMWQHGSFFYAAEIKDFVIIPIHTTPEAAVKEIDELHDVHRNVSQHWQSKNFIIMGDFNAACGYVPKKEWRNIRLRSDSSYVWLTDDKLDTSVKESTRCAYDRVVLHGKAMIQAVKPESVEVYDFKDAFGLTEQEALTVSDHFPLCINVNAARRKG